ncbi:HK97 family phage prohead protease [Dichotomicrobium thermohalophilum]|uniref:Prohead peptidase n=1 Tax=Dichotomicrobium thermohalophilum TaxID=933063 RepID=A0A397Q8D6_9HYPH|nr:HK97 family phage prohead protease [Dichotomicrobium thermohalophilum]RIA56769.1 prohead peptidase [Dichotomicrobium thermohalophilum]
MKNLAIKRAEPRHRRERASVRVSETDGRVEGYASLFGVPDYGGDVVMPGAFAASLRRRGPCEVRFLFQHDPAQPIGVWDEIREDKRGLYVRGRLIGGVMRAREVAAMLRAGALDGLSIGFRTVRADRDPRLRTRRLHEIDLWEISVVTFPMLPGAKVSRIEQAGATALAGVARRLQTMSSGLRQASRHSSCQPTQMRRA